MEIKRQIGKFLKKCRNKQSQIFRLKQQLFGTWQITPNKIWNIIHSNNQINIQPVLKNKVNTSHKLLTKYISFEDIRLFLKKVKKSNIQSKDIQLILHSYSTQEDGKLTKQDLWEIFKPKTLKYIESILKERQSRKYMVQFCEQAHYRVKDLLAQILSLSINFEKVIQQMKKVVANKIAKGQNCKLVQINAKQLQLFVKQSQQSFSIIDAEIVLDFIYKNKSKIGFQKTFYDFFIPFGVACSRINPIHQLDVLEQKQGLQLSHYHKKVARYGKSLHNMKKAKYLQIKQNIYKRY